MFYEIFILIRFSLELTLKLKFPKAFPVHNKVNNGLKLKSYDSFFKSCRMLNGLFHEFNFV
jgi:hypothetical protein